MEEESHFSINDASRKKINSFSAAFCDEHIVAGFAEKPNTFIKYGAFALY